MTGYFYVNKDTAYSIILLEKQLQKKWPVFSLLLFTDREIFGCQFLRPVAGSLLDAYAKLNYHNSKPTTPALLNFVS